MSKDISLDPKVWLAGLRRFARTAKRYAAISFFVLLAGLYGFVLLRINMLSSVQPDANQVSSQTSSAGIPRIDSRVVSQLESLEDNSVTVRSLFDQARSNPFQE